METGESISSILKNWFVFLNVRIRQRMRVKNLVLFKEDRRTASPDCFEKKDSCSMIGFDIPCLVCLLECQD